MERSLAKDEERIDVLEKMVLRLYEDMVAGRISEANFNLLMEKTQKEQAELKARVEEGRKKLADEIRLEYDARQWVEAIQEYADITELDAATLNRLIKEIVVHESIDSDKTRHISIEIHFNLKPIPEVEQEAAHGGRRRCADRHDTCTPAFRAVRLKSAGKSLCRAYLTRSRNG